VTELRILLLEDNPNEAELNERVLRKAGLKFISMRVDTEPAFKQSLGDFQPDIVLADYNLPSYNGRAALITYDKLFQTCLSSWLPVPSVKRERQSCCGQVPGTTF